MRILIAEDHRIVLDGIALLLSSIDGIEVVSKRTNGRQFRSERKPRSVDVGPDECGGTLVGVGILALPAVDERVGHGHTHAGARFNRFG